MKRHAQEPALTWKPSAGEAYRVAVRNEDTGERRTIYNGLKPTCRLPSAYRATPDQLSFRVEARPEGDPDKPFRRIQDFLGIDRLGDDFTTPADDLLEAAPVAGATLYRLLVRELPGEASLVDFCRREPKFLLPAGRLQGRRAEWTIIAEVNGAWTSGRWLRVSPAAVAAAQARAERPLEPPRSEAAIILENDAPWRPGRASSVGTGQEARAARLLAIVDVTAAPELASRPDPVLVVAEQWDDGRGEGCVMRVARTLEREGLKGLFFLDVFAGEVLGFTALAALARRLAGSGHALGLMVKSAPWIIAAPQLADGGTSPADLLARALTLWKGLAEAAPTAIRFGPGLLTTDSLLAARAAGMAGVFFNPPENRALPRWMRSRTTPFAALDGLTAFPVSSVLSTPAHIRDRVLHHTVSNKDPLMAAGAQRIGEETARSRTAGAVLTIHIDPLALLAVRKVRSPEAAGRWNMLLEADRPAWLAAGWSRRPDGFDLADGPNEIAGDVLNGLLAGVAASGLQPFDLTHDPAAAMQGAAHAGSALEPLIEERRGPHILRRSGVRRYDNAYRMALNLDAAR